MTSDLPDLPDTADVFDASDLFVPSGWHLPPGLPGGAGSAGPSGPSDPSAPLAGPFAGRLAFRDAVRRAFAEAASAGWRELWCCDETFADWPLNDATVIASLVRWARPQRRLTLIARHFDDLAVRHPRWVAWRRTWSHVVVCRAVEPEMRLDVPTLLCAPPSCTLRLADRVRHLGTLTTDAHDAVAAREQIDAISQRSSETFGATTLGL